MKTTAAAFDVVRPPAQGITILIYHRVGAGTGGQMDLSPVAFDEQLAWLQATQRLLSLDQAVAELTTSNDHAQPDRSGVVLTFDDGTADWVDHALPALVRHDVPATFYVATGFVDGSAALPDDAAPISWAGLSELASSPLVTLGSHTHSHALMDRLAPEQIDDELDRSIELIGEHTGVHAEHFCYPKALAGSAAAEAAIRQRFRSATLAGTRPNAVGTDPYRLARSPVQPTDGRRWFRRKATGGMALENDLRDLLNRARYRGATS